jgi:hypothetical protein
MAMRFKELRDGYLQAENVLHVDSNSGIVS